MLLPLVIIGLVAGGFGGQAWFGDLHGTSLSIKWTSPYDSPNTLATQGVWVQGDSVIRIRTDNVVSYASATGSTQWTFTVPGQDIMCAVPEQAPNYQLSLLSVQPVVISDVQPAPRSLDNVLVFTAQGKQNVTIPVTSINSPDGPATLEADPIGVKAFAPQTLWWTVVTDGRLVGVTKNINDHVDAVAFDLATGRQDWLTALPATLEAVALHGNRLVVIDATPPALVMHSISVANGSVSEIGVINSRPFGNNDTGLYPVGNRYVAVNDVGVNPAPAVFAFGG